jgi:hypothetical protein
VRDVPTPWQIDDQRIRSAIATIVLGQLAAKPVGADANDVVGLWIERAAASEHHRADDQLLEASDFSVQRRIDGEPEERRELVRLPEQGVTGDALHLCKYIGPRDRLGVLRLRGASAG